MPEAVEYIPDIIRESSRDPLGVVALMIIAISIITYLFFKKSKDKHKLSVLFLIIGVFLFFFTNLNWYYSARAEKEGEQEGLQNEVAAIDKSIADRQQARDGKNTDTIKALEEEKKQLEDEIEGSKNAPLKVDATEKKEERVDVAIVIGHKRTSPGYVDRETGISEFSYSEDLGHRLHEMLENDSIHSHIIYRDTYRELPKKINAYSPRVVVSLHANSFNGRVSGSSVLFREEGSNAALAECLLSDISQTLGLPNRGIRSTRTHDRGGYLIHNVDAPTFIIQPFFMDNKSDLDRATGKQEELAAAIKRCLVLFIRFRKDT